VYLPRQSGHILEFHLIAEIAEQRGVDVAAIQVAA
jgi:hypothetical protein